MRTSSAKLQLRENNNSRATIVSNLFFIIGTGIILAALVYMIVNLNKADSIITMWITFMAAGVLLAFYGLIIKILTRNSERKIRNFTRGSAI
jgi:ABC-type transport system involved in cytochrome c biogenesis permease component